MGLSEDISEFELGVENSNKNNDNPLSSSGSVVFSYYTTAGLASLQKGRWCGIESRHGHGLRLDLLTGPLRAGSSTLRRLTRKQLFRILYDMQDHAPTILGLFCLLLFFSGLVIGGINKKGLSHVVCESRI